MEEEQQLIQRSQLGEQQAFNELVEMYQGQVYNLALRMLSDSAMAEDAAQETFIAAYRAIGGFRGGNFRSWLLRITANTCKDFMRAARSRSHLSLDAMELMPNSDPPSKEESPEDYTLRRELGQAIHAGLENTPYDQRLALVLIDVQGYSYEEAATIMGTSVGTVRSRLSRGRHKLAEYMRRHPELLPSRFRL